MYKDLTREPLPFFPDDILRLYEADEDLGADTPEDSRTPDTIKVLVATMETQGQRANDFCCVPTGELVWVAAPCGTDRRAGGATDPDGSCGCGRSFVGIESPKGTTTAQVVEMDWDGIARVAPQDRARFLVLVEASYLVEDFPAGAIVERRGDILQIRQSEESLRDADVRALWRGDEPPTGEEHDDAD